MTEQVNSNTTTLDNKAPLQQLIEHLKPLHVILSKNSYVKDTTKRLNRIIEDAESQPIILILGKERVGKTTLINSLLGRSLLENSKNQPTNVNTFLRYGEQECIKAVFLDGMIAMFDISKLKLLTVSDTFSAQIIREHIDFIEVYIKHDLLKEVTIVDSTALEVGANNTAYFSQSLLQRVDEVFWLLRNDSPASEEEVNLIRKLEKYSIKPHLVVNAIDEAGGKVSEFIASEKARYGNYIGEVVAVSALLALEARKTNNSQLLIDSYITELSQLIQKVSSDKQKKTQHVSQLFIHWLERLRKEVEVIPAREPYISAFENVEQFQPASEFEFRRQQRDMALIASYDEEYQSDSGVFNDVQTLYQLLQKVSSEVYLRDSLVEEYEEIAVLYQQSVRDYRKLHVEYTMEYTRMEKNYKKLTGYTLSIPLENIENESFIADQVEKLNKIHQQCAEKMEFIQNYEEFVCKNLYTVQNRLNELATKRLKIIINQVGDLNLQRKNERTYLKSYINKLSEFNCIVEAQGFLRDAILPYMQDGALPISEQEKQHIRNTIDCICAVDLTHQALSNRLTISEPDDLLAQLEFESKYKLAGLSLTEADVKSELPDMPSIIQL